MKIFIVDDEVINCILFINMFYNVGYKECVEVVDGVEVIKKFMYEKFDLVLLDVVMFGFSGFDVVFKICKFVKGLYLFIFFIIVLEDKESLVRCLEVGGNDFVIKFFDWYILIVKIWVYLKICVLSEYIE